jgi:hypothetical protein
LRLHDIDIKGSSVLPATSRFLSTTPSARGFFQDRGGPGGPDEWYGICIMLRTLAKIGVDATSTVRRAAEITFVTFACALIGFAVQWLVPAQTIVDAKSMVTAMVGLVALLLAIVLGLLIWTSNGVYTTQLAEAQSLGPLILQLDFILEQYGPEAKKGRELFRDEIVRFRERFWGELQGVRAATSFLASRSDMREMTMVFAELNPASEEQRQFLAASKQLSGTIIQTQLLMARQLANPVPWVLLVIVLCWSSLIFFCYGLTSNFNGVSVAVEAFGAMAVSSAIFLILELNQPYNGLFHISPAGVDQVIAAIG